MQEKMENGCCTWMSPPQRWCTLSFLSSLGSSSTTQTLHSKAWVRDIFTCRSGFFSFTVSDWGEQTMRLRLNGKRISKEMFWCVKCNSKSQKLTAYLWLLPTYCLTISKPMTASHIEQQNMIIIVMKIIVLSP